MYFLINNGENKNINYWRIKKRKICYSKLFVLR